MRNFKVSKNVGLLRWLGAVALIAWAVAATAARPVAVVTPLETQNYSLGNQVDTAHAYIEDALVNSGTASVVDRQRMDAMVQDGVYVGSTPTEIALPEGNASDIKISKAGFQAWNKRVQPREGMQINVELAPEMPSG